MDSATSKANLKDKEEKREMDQDHLRRKNDRQGKILIVDDEPKNIRIIEEMLAPDVYQFLTASSGKSALDKAISDSPDLILLDNTTPEFNGNEVASALKGDSRTKNIPIILVTELAELEKRNMGQEA